MRSPKQRKCKSALGGMHFCTVLVTLVNVDVLVEKVQKCIGVDALSQKSMRLTPANIRQCKSAKVHLYKREPLWCTFS